MEERPKCMSCRHYQPVYRERSAPWWAVGWCAGPSIMHRGWLGSCCLINVENEGCEAYEERGQASRAEQSPAPTTGAAGPRRAEQSPAPTIDNNETEE